MFDDDDDDFNDEFYDEWSDSFNPELFNFDDDVLRDNFDTAYSEPINHQVTRRELDELEEDMLLSYGSPAVMKVDPESGFITVTCKSRKKLDKYKSTLFFRGYLPMGEFVFKTISKKVVVYKYYFDLWNKLPQINFN